MEFTIDSRKLKRPVTFWRGQYYICVNLNGQPGCLGQQICEKGRLFSGSCLGVSDGRNDQETQEAFERVCKAWWKQFCAQYDADYLY